MVPANQGAVVNETMVDAVAAAQDARIRGNRIKTSDARLLLLMPIHPDHLLMVSFGGFLRVVYIVGIRRKLYVLYRDNAL